MATDHAVHHAEPRQVAWRLFCPRCLSPHEFLRHVGTENTNTQIVCDDCGKPYQVRTRVDGMGTPLCQATPVFIRAPELVEDNAPLKRPR